ncbi:Tetratricopeptide repeat protein 4 -like protein [Babesia sp. Xinjiang]|uniref:Tetratricopeptide repeat protein 4 -like protein n=1 Tax=Babesia sp. Xinjiang TaxID=462227 RepID=UPI000A2527EE|nr:Tetratricopeptide repeat protein 4 -like protein [Babesia sp. Xinjiang]ORM40091.1 Tetratricopeptide repeat protein 4 -like protein [Babesia sp. Xinjiang]
MWKFLGKWRKSDKGGSSPAPRNLRRTVSQRKINNSFLRIREIDEDDEKYVRKLLFDHFRSQTFPAIMYWIVQHVHDLIAIIAIISFLLPLRSLVYFCICFLVYLYVRARFEIERHIRYSCPDLDAVYITYRSTKGSNFWVGYFSESGDIGNVFDSKPPALTVGPNEEPRDDDRESATSARSEGGVDSSHSNPDSESSPSREGDGSIGMKKYPTQVEAAMKLKDVLTPTNCKENEILGCIGIAPYRNKSTIAQMVRLVVSKKCRNMKVGSQLLNHLENFAIGFGYTEIRVYTNNLNTAYLQFLKMNGFVIRQIVRRGLMRGDLIIWNKVLSQPEEDLLITESASQGIVMTRLRRIIGIFAVTVWFISDYSFVYGKDYYSLLGVPRTASEAEISKAYRSKARKLHPDVAPGREDEFKAINTAYEVLKDADKRQQYDLYGESGVNGSSGPSQGYQTHDFFHQGGWSHHGNGSGFTIDMSDGMFDGFFEQFGFGNRRQHGGGHQSYHGHKGGGTVRMFEGTIVDDVDVNGFKVSLLNLRAMNMYFFYMDTCPHCREAKHAFVEFATKFKGAIRTYAVNCNRYNNLCIQHNIEKVPQIIVFSSPQTPVYYQKRNFSDQLESFVSKHLPSLYVELVDSKGLSSFLNEDSAVLKVVAIIRKGAYLIKLKALAKDLHGKVSFGFVRGSNTAIVGKFGPSGLTQTGVLIIVDDPASLRGTTINLGAMDYNDVILKLNLAVFESTRGHGGNVSGGVYTKLTARRMSKGECSDRDNQYCFLFIRFGKGSEESIHESLYKIAKRYSNDPIKVRYLDAKEQILEEVSSIEVVERFINDVISGAITLRRSFTHLPKLVADPDFLRKFTKQYSDVDHPLFMEELPHDPSGNEDLEALHQLLAEGETRESIAEKYKEVGNGYVQQGPYFYEAAISSYTKGIDAECNNTKLNAQLYLNRALVHLKLRNFVKCIDDCNQSIKRDASNVKAYYRAAVASCELELYRKALSFCLAYYDHVKSEDPGTDRDLLSVLECGSADFVNVYKRCVDKLRARDKKLCEIKKQAKKAKLEELNVLKGVLQLLKSNGIKFRKDFYEIPKTQRVVFYHDNGCLHTSCLFIYDERGVTDYIEDFDYSTTVGDQLDVMFPDSSDPSAFTRHNSKCIYEVGNGEFFEFGTQVTLATVIYQTKVAYRVAPIHVVHLDFDTSILNV